MADRRAKATRRRDERGAASQRLVLALAASALLTAAVSLPMAYQAHEARQSDEAEQQRVAEPPAEVLGSTTIKQPEAVTDDIYWQLASADPELLHQASVQGTPRVFLQADDVVRADFRLDDGPVETDTTEPFELSDGAPVRFAGGQHSVTATVTYADGRSQLHQAFFTAPG
jgi:hypothetical protein